MVFNFNIDSTLLQSDNCPEDAREIFNQVMIMVEKAVNSREFLALFFYLCQYFAEGICFQWNTEDVEKEWNDWIAQHPVPDKFLSIKLVGKLLKTPFGEYTVATREIGLDMTLLNTSQIRNLEYANRVKFLFFVKALHGIAYSLTGLIISFFLDHLYQKEFKAEALEKDKKRKKESSITPSHIKKFGTLFKLKGDCGYGLEELMTGLMPTELMTTGLRFTYRNEPNNLYKVDFIVGQIPDKNSGYYIPQHVINSIIANPQVFYTLLKYHFRDKERFIQVSEQEFNNLVIKCPTKKQSESPRRIQF